MDKLPVPLVNPTDAVFVIESLPAGDITTGQNVLANAISPHARRAGAYVHLPAFLCSSIEALDQALASIRAITERRGLRPVLQFDCHGCPDGFQLADYQILPWDAFAARLLPINEAARNSLLVVASACDGAYLAKGLTRVYRLAAPDPLIGRTPFWGLIGPLGTVSPEQLSRGLEAFYMHLLGANAPDKAIAALSQQVPLEVLYAEIVHAKAFSRYISAHLDPSFVDNRVAEMQRAGLGDAASLRAQIMDFEGRFNYYRRRYLWLDRFAAEAWRFPVDYALMVQLNG